MLRILFLLLIALPLALPAQTAQHYRIDTDGWGIEFTTTEALRSIDQASSLSSLKSEYFSHFSGYSYWHTQNGRQTQQYDLCHYALQLDEVPTDLRAWVKPWLTAATQHQHCLRILAEPHSIRFMGQAAVQVEYTTSAQAECTAAETVYHRMIVFKMQERIRILVLSCRKEKMVQLKAKLDHILQSFHYAS